jgi:hypothetical protein
LFWQAMSSLQQDFAAHVPHAEAPSPAEQPVGEPDDPEDEEEEEDEEPPPSAGVPDEPDELPPEEEVSSFFLSPPRLPNGLPSPLSSVPSTAFEHAAVIATSAKPKAAAIIFELTVLPYSFRAFRRARETLQQRVCRGKTGSNTM